MRRIYNTDPYIGQLYGAYQGMNRIFMEITDLSDPNGDSWVEFRNVDTKQSYNCRLDAFLARYTAIAE